MSDEKYILVVDDDQTTLAMLGYYFKSIDVPYLTASDGESALQILRDQAEEICLVLLDLAMPHMDGYEVCRAIRADPKLAEQLELLELPRLSTANVREMFRSAFSMGSFSHSDTHKLVMQHLYNRATSTRSRLKRRKIDHGDSS